MPNALNIKNKLKVIDIKTNRLINPSNIRDRAQASWIIDAGESVNVLQAGYEIRLFDAKTSKAIYESGKIYCDNSINAALPTDILERDSDYYYQVKVWDNEGNESDFSEKAFFRTAIKSLDFGKFISGGDSCYLRKSFKSKGAVESARVYSTALGLYKLYLNGKEIDNDLLKPGWTSYNKRLSFQTYDVTELMTSESNTLGATVGVGWYKGEIAWLDNSGYYGDTIAFMAELHVTYKDGSKEILFTDESWTSHENEISFSQIYHGETYDARSEISDWCSPSPSSGEGWKNVSVVDYDKSKLIPSQNEPVREIMTVRPKEIFKDTNGDAVIDFGQNMVGYVRFTVSGKAGDVVELHHAEVLDKEGRFYTENLRNARQIIKYTLKGDGEETYVPHFTFQGFRYIRVASFPGLEKGLPDLKNFEGVVICSDIEVTGDFECSNPLVNRLFQNVIWGQRGNFVEVPTDCPQRDERLGWTGDIQVFAETAAYNMGSYSFLEKWLGDVTIDQRADGAVPVVVPHVLSDNDYGTAAWGDAATIVPWQLYRVYGNKAILEKQFGSMKKWVDFLYDSAEENGLWEKGGNIGDWLALDSEEGALVGITPIPFIASAFQLISTEIVLESAKVLELNDEVSKYQALYNETKETFNEKYFTNGDLNVDTQTAAATVVVFDLALPHNQKLLKDKLIQLVNKFDGHLSTGFVGAPYIANALTKLGLNDLVFNMFLKESIPSWLYQVKMGATTIWEHWDGIKPDGTFWSKDMNSFNHYAYGSIAQWMHNVIGGLNIAEGYVAFKKSDIKPLYDSRLSNARSSLKTVYGLLENDWAVKDGKITYKITVPVNTTANFYPPAQCDGSGKVINLGSGVHEFEFSLKN